MRPRGLLDYRALQNFSQARCASALAANASSGRNAWIRRPTRDGTTHFRVPGGYRGRDARMRPRRDVGTVLSGRSVGVRIYMYCTNSRFTCFGDHHGDFGTVGCGDNASRAALRFVKVSGGGGVCGRDPQSRRVSGNGSPDLERGGPGGWSLGPFGICSYDGPETIRSRKYATGSPMCSCRRSS
jgi:hypothetical protein